MILKINSERLAEAIRSIGAHPVSNAIFERKAKIIPYKMVQVRTPAINIIKQEMLGVGGDAVTPVGAILNKDKYGDVLLLGTEKHYKLLVQKMQAMQFFGLGKWAEELEAQLTAPVLQTVFKDGRKLTYEKTRVMGILNVTPDSFYAASRVTGVKEVLDRADKLLQEGADLLDIGAESTRPGSTGITPEEEEQRLLPALAALRKEFPQALLSVDTWHAQTAAAALEQGADLINDVTALTGDQKLLDVVVQNQVPVILMHNQGLPTATQSQGVYADVVEEVTKYLAERAALLTAKGYTKEQIILDPGIGFGKNTQQNLLLMRDLSVLGSLGYPVLLAASRKRVIGQVLGQEQAEARLQGTVATTLQAVLSGAQMVRVHDVKANVEAIRMLEAIRQPEKW